MSRNLRSGSTMACKTMLQFFSRSSHTLFKASTEGKVIIMCVLSTAPQQLERPLKFSNLDFISSISVSVEGQLRWCSPLSSIASTNLHVTWETVDWFILNESPMVDNDSPELSLLRAIATWSFRDKRLPFKSTKFEALASRSSSTREHI
ncbi:hypothetical protein V8G54_034103 [Vigna mungo]|uniref:Uncharacterized protein n=1 Tax=Vigna mungo TaxID=3915 RepID=A0AAQ3MQ38_VIGMU